MEEWYAFLLPPCPWIPHFCVSVSALIINTTRDGFIYDGSVGKESACNAREPQERRVWSLGQEDQSPAEGNCNPLQCSCLGNPIGQRSLVGYSPWGCKESDTTEHACSHRKGRKSQGCKSWELLSLLQLLLFCLLLAFAISVYYLPTV